MIHSLYKKYRIFYETFQRQTVKPAALSLYLNCLIPYVQYKNIETFHVYF